MNAMENLRERLRVPVLIGLMIGTIAVALAGDERAWLVVLLAAVLSAPVGTGPDLTVPLLHLALLAAALVVGNVFIIATSAVLLVVEIGVFLARRSNRRLDSEAPPTTSVTADRRSGADDGATDVGSRDQR